VKPIAAAAGLGAAFAVGEEVVQQIIPDETVEIATGAALVPQLGAVGVPATGIAVDVQGRPVPTFAAGAGVRGRGQVMFRTIIQRISMANGAVLSQQVKSGKPWLMNSEVAALKRVSRMVGKAHGKIPRKSVKSTLKSVGKDIQEVAQMQLILKALTDGKAC